MNADTIAKLFTQARARDHGVSVCLRGGVFHFILLHEDPAFDQSTSTWTLIGTLDEGPSFAEGEAVRLVFRAEDVSGILVPELP